MKFGCFLLFLGALVQVRVQSASVHRRDIPVEVVYDSALPGVRNLDEKVQLSQNELQLDQVGHQESAANSAVRNLDEKIQLSADERADVLKHLPLSEEEPQLQLKSTLLQDSAQQASTQSESDSLLATAKEIIYLGLKTLKLNIEKSNEALKPDEEAWKSLNSSVEGLFKDQQQIGVVKQDNPSNQNQIINNIISGFQNFTSNFVQNFQQNNQGANGTEDEQQPGFAQNFINSFTGGVQQIVNNINNLSGQSSTSNTVLGDTGTTESSNIFTNVINGIQQIFTGPNQGNPSQIISLNQSDTGTQPTTSAPNFIQGAINQFNQVVSNFRPPAPPAPSGQEDEQTATTQGPNPIQIIQSIGNQIGNAFNQAISQSSKPPNSEDEGTASTQSTNFIQNIGQAIQNANPFRPPEATQAPPGEGQQGSNPITSGAQAVGNQIQQLVGGANNQPLESIQNAISGAVAPTTEKAKSDSSLSSTQAPTSQAPTSQAPTSQAPSIQAVRLIPEVTQAPAAPKEAAEVMKATD